MKTLKKVTLIFALSFLLSACNDTPSYVQVSTNSPTSDEAIEEERDYMIVKGIGTSDLQEAIDKAKANIGLLDYMVKNYVETIYSETEESSHSYQMISYLYENDVRKNGYIFNSETDISYFDAYYLDNESYLAEEYYFIDEGYYNIYLTNLYTKDSDNYFVVETFLYDSYSSYTYEKIFSLIDMDLIYDVNDENADYRAGYLNDEGIYASFSYLDMDTFSLITIEFVIYEDMFEEYTLIVDYYNEDMDTLLSSYKTSSLYQSIGVGVIENVPRGDISNNSQSNFYS